MALFNEIQEGRFNNLLRKVTGVRNAPSAQVSSEIMPVFNPFLFGKEVGFLEGWAFFRYGFRQAGAAGVLGGAVIRVAPQSLLSPGQTTPNLFRIIVIERVIISLSIADQVLLQNKVTGNYASNVAAGFAEDFRGVARSYAIGSSQNTGQTSYNTIGSFNIAAATPFDVLQGREYVFVTQPVNSDGLAIQPQTVNNTMDVEFVWRERIATEGEQIF